MIKQYSIVTLSSTVWTPQKRKDIMEYNLRRIARQILAAKWACEVELPVRLVVLPELAITAAPDETRQMDHVQAAREIFIDIPGEETEYLGKLCKKQGFYLVAQAKARDPEFMPDRFFNISFIIDPDGKVIHKHRKTHVAVIESSVCPTDIWDIYLEKFGTDPKRLLEAVFPVARTEIGNIGTLVCAEGAFPEAARALALNGAEIICRTAYLEPRVSNGIFEVQNRSHAIFNACYVISPNTGPVHSFPETYEDWRHAWPMDYSGNQSQIIDYRGQIIGQHVGAVDYFTSAIINIEALRDYRLRTLIGSYSLRDLRVDQYSLIYKAAEAMGGIYPRNLYMDELPLSNAEAIQVRRYVQNKLVDKGICIPPSDWKPHKISKGITQRIENAAVRST